MHCCCELLLLLDYFVITHVVITHGVITHVVITHDVITCDVITCDVITHDVITCDVIKFCLQQHVFTIQVLRDILYIPVDDIPHRGKLWRW